MVVVVVVVVVVGHLAILHMHSTILFWRGGHLAILHTHSTILLWGGGVVEFDAESKFAKIQNSYVRWGVVLWNLMPSPNLLKSKIPMSGGGGGGRGVCGI